MSFFYPSFSTILTRYGPHNSQMVEFSLCFILSKNKCKNYKFYEYFKSFSINLEKNFYGLIFHSQFLKLRWELSIKLFFLK